MIELTHIRQFFCSPSGLQLCFYKVEQQFVNLIILIWLILNDELLLSLLEEELNKVQRKSRSLQFLDSFYTFCSCITNHVHVDIDLAVEHNQPEFHILMTELSTWVSNQTISDISLAEVSTDTSYRLPLIWSGSYSQVCIHESRGGNHMVERKQS